MALVDLNKPGEKKKVIWAAVLGLVAIIFLWWTFFGFGSSRSGNVRATASSTPQPQRAGTQNNNPRANPGPSSDVVNLADIRPIEFRLSSYDAPEAKRNIFAYYEPPVVQKPAPTEKPTPPPPPPPVLLASVSPANVYARAPEFKLEAAGDKFTSATRIYVDGRELPTAYISPQQLSATVP